MKVKAHESNRYVKLEFIQQEQQSHNTKLVGAGYIDPFTPFHMISSSGFILKKNHQRKYPCLVPSQAKHTSIIFKNLHVYY